MRRAAAALALAATAGCGAPHATQPAHHTRPGWTTFRDRAHGLEVRFPSDWFRARRRLTPYLSDPVEILSLATFPLRPGPEGACEQMPVAAMRRAGGTDVLVSLQERGTGAAGFPPRPRHFDLRRGLGSEADACVGAPRPWRSHWFPFADRGRGFYLLAIVGDRVSPARRAALQRVIDGLRFDAAGSGR